MADKGNGTKSSASNTNIIEQALLSSATAMQNNNNQLGTTENQGGVVTIKQFHELKPPTFDGSNDPLVAESWDKSIEKIF